jgi:hypothetical protein
MTEAKKADAGDVYMVGLEDAVAKLRHLIVTLEGAPGTSPYTAAAVADAKKSLAALDGA